MTSIYHEIWKRKDLIFDFAISDLKIKYRNSILGFFWTFLEPLLLLAVLFIVFTNIFKSDIEHFPLYILLGLIMWNMLSRGTELGLNSITSRSALLTQIYFSRAIPSISSAITSLLMLCFELIVFMIFMIAFQFTPPRTVVILPFVLFLEFILVIGLSLPLSVLNARYRDTQFIWKVILQAGFFLTPIFYRLDILPQEVQEILYFSPMVQMVNIAHDGTLYNILPSSESISIAVITTFIVLFCGYMLYRKFQKRMIEEL